ncbi:hypothetical protein RJT34_16533 [Clitoria ternatea]|uniref:Uncharacterized protein n=1 Tax=Clitoria ternatea TaxID=43366 RepID=A0AAN9PCY1_CLITE
MPMETLPIDPVDPINPLVTHLQFFPSQPPTPHVPRGLLETRQPTDQPSSSPDPIGPPHQPDLTQTISTSAQPESTWSDEGFTGDQD